ncbi:hypothetical protein KDH83_04620 [Achromobacter sp. Marseille-Q0513]|uniref:hypothetical protein n=1 Tax=Achromobacter sp. Marseille-Q0513 TaxID=2829161 RepID=UPI001B9948B8|nr:hypothetical protein [Achromobacter sp. Marseille-Q0513]MBR8652593.1 hypothetical protein [Achromobacter sp. Marseille-Q0513]
MKTIVLALSLSLAAFSATAQTNSASSSTTSATSGATNAGNTQGITFNSKSDASGTLRTAPAMGGQSFYGSFSSDSCMVSAGGGGSVVGFGMNVAFPIEDQKCSLRRNFERTMQAAASTKDPDRSRRLETAAIDILCQTDDRTKAALVAQGLCTNPALTTADPRFDNPAVAQPSAPAAAPPASPAALAPTPQTPVAQAFPVQSVQSGAMSSPPLRNPRLDRQGMLDMYSPG